MLKHPFINHKNKNPKNNEINNLQVIKCEASFEEVTEEEKKKIIQQSLLDVNNIIHEDTGKELHV